MRATQAERLVERIFHKYGESYSPLTAEEAYDELKKICGCDFGSNEVRWRAWLAEQRTAAEERPAFDED